MPSKSFFETFFNIVKNKRVILHEKIIYEYKNNEKLKKKEKSITRTSRNSYKFNSIRNETFIKSS